MSEPTNIWDKYGDKLPVIFGKTIYRVPTKAELKEVNTFNMTANDLVQGFGYTIVGRGISTDKTKKTIIDSISELVKMYPDNKEYKDALEMSKEIKIHYMAESDSGAGLGFGTERGTAEPIEPAIDQVNSYFDKTEEKPKKKKRIKKFVEFSKEYKDMVYGEPAVTSYPQSDSR